MVHLSDPARPVSTAALPPIKTVIITAALPPAADRLLPLPRHTTRGFLSACLYTELFVCLLALQEALGDATRAVTRRCTLAQIAASVQLHGDDDEDLFRAGCSLLSTLLAEDEEG